MVFEKGSQKKKKNKRPGAAIVILIISLGTGNILSAQTPITLQAATDTALKNNLLVKNEQLKAQYQQLLINTATAIPKTSFVADAGQINSIYTDTKFSVAQSFSFPKMYTKQKELLQLEWKSSVLNVSVQEALLKKQVAQLYYRILYVEQKKLLLQYADSLYTAFYKKAELRLAKGESNIL
jgi:cobalt-zinc-cadmium resistance protein CzcA